MVIITVACLVVTRQSELFEACSQPDFVQNGAQTRFQLLHRLFRWAEQLGWLVFVRQERGRIDDQRDPTGMNQRLVQQDLDALVLVVCDAEVLIERKMVAFAADAGILHANILDFRIAAAGFQRKGVYSIG